MSLKDHMGKKALAISYNEEECDAPVSAAFGIGHIADNIVSIAREAGVSVVEDSNTASMFSKISVGDEIPEEMYEAVGSIILYISELDRKYGQQAKYLPA